MLSDEQLEAAAREYCEVLGLDPDANIWSNRTERDEPRWKVLIFRIREHQAMGDAIQHARDLGWIG